MHESMSNAMTQRMAALAQAMSSMDSAMSQFNEQTQRLCTIIVLTDGKDKKAVDLYFEMQTRRVKFFESCSARLLAVVDQSKEEINAMASGA